MTLNREFQILESAEYKDLSATVVKPFEPFTSSVPIAGWVIAAATTTTGRRCHEHPPSTITYDLIQDFDNRPDIELWEDWMWEVCTWFGKVSSYDTELAAYWLLHGLQGRYIPRLFGVVRLHIIPDSIPLHLITDIVQGLVLDN
ncbi:uncharacterized protein BT62DRAFT_1011607 [Guyanagaster necrorhizus]|uniref:Uncharacterized protein n=1 Tax=Guyanagaster necrorhizus TaxID=856835 RepID=A0A9P7VJ88_9AGAR|nr:uncharacterized protein BT62DRAFT_1011607 [Guyanagaster necrorhizus MCA 3950]KAG7441360.1 hypothetical protein BT62DRAFT_1011607 [Guyanagaster necrorhizus MCA 3950]